MRLMLIASLLLMPLLALCDEEFREDFDSLAEWTARADWLAADAQEPVAQVEDGVALFAINEPNRGMKWQRFVDQADSDMAPWLVIRYRAEEYNQGIVDYAFWVRDATKGRDGLKVVTGDMLQADGQWHTVAVDLSRRATLPPISQLALQVFATDTGRAKLWVDYIVLTDTPPKDAEGYRRPAGDKTWPVDMSDPSAWTVEPSWLANYSPENEVAATQAGTRFAVARGGTGAKWSRDLGAAIEGAAWVSMRYRAESMRGGTDYALYIAGEPGGQAKNEEYVIPLGYLAPDGEWHVQRSRVGIPSVKTLAVQVQALADDADIEIAQIVFSQARPPVRLADEFEYAPGWPANMDGYRPVTLPAGNVDGASLARKLGYEGALPEGRLSVAGIPFEIRGGADAGIMTQVRQLGTIEVPLSDSGAELYMVLAAKLPLRDEPAFGNRPMQAITQAERFMARIEYADGMLDEQFPVLLSRGRHSISRGLHVYALALEPDKALKRVTLRDGMRRGAFGLIAATIGEAPGPATEATRFAPAITVPELREARPRRPGFEQQGTRLIFDAPDLRLTMDTEDGLRITGIENHSYDGAPLRMRPGPLFRLKSADEELTSEDFRVKDVVEVGEVKAQRVLIELVCEKTQPPIKVTVEVVPYSLETRELSLAANVDLGGRDAAEWTFFFPELRGLQFSDDLADTWYWMPRRGGLINNVPLVDRQPYCGAMPMQIIGAFSPRQGTGLYVMTQDLEGTPRYYNVGKSVDGVRLGVEYNPCGPRTPRTVIGCNQGDWHAQFARYKRWTDQWCKPAAPRKRWFREVFNFRQQFMHFTLPTKSGMFDPETKAFRLKEVVEQDAEAFGGVDYLHLFDWGWDPVHGRCGDYKPWDYLGPPENFKAAVEEVKDADVPVGLYIEGYLVDPPSDLAKAKGEKWQLLDAKGDPYPYFAPSFNICSLEKEWQEYLPAVYKRTRQQTGAVGFYIDEYGFSQPNHNCYNKNHDHPIPGSPVLGEREMTKAVREALGPESAVYTEESPADITSMYQDGSFTYAISTAQDYWSPHHVNLYRFAFPTFKTIEIIVCDKPLGSNVEAVKRILFNGEAIWIEGIWDKWFEPETRDYIARMHKVLRDNRQCFAGDYPEPLVPTLLQGIYANRFAEKADGTGKTCWTVYNTKYRTARGEIIRVKHLPGAQYANEFTGEALTARIDKGTAALSFEVGPRDVAVISRTVPEG